MINLCAPAIIYVIFSITQVIIDLYKGFFNTALVKFFVMIMITLLLNILCERGLGVISWFIVFIPFILMTVIVSLLLYFFGLNATTGTFNCSSSSSTSTSSSTSSTTTTNNNPNDTYSYYNPDTQNNNSYSTSSQNTNTQNNSSQNTSSQNNNNYNSSTQNSNTNVAPPPLYISSSPAYQSL